MFGENYGTATLLRSLALLAEDIRKREDYGEPLAELQEDARRLMEGSIVLWERMMMEDE